ncbi:MAG TPA: pyrroloquinoline quinone biosynthesis protein PqqB [Candidatus Binataceae bacterium]|nr:pyrroloquinoline quinone biosynthesis protein PqqB [Candidatus Binataceae bacterium]
MKLLVLGAAAGGGFPQWNCNCRNCDGLRAGRINARARTQSSIAVSAGGSDWALINVSPDILAQIKARPQLQPARTVRDTGVKAVVLVDSQIDHTVGLAMLREGAQLGVYCTRSVYEDLTTGNPILRMLESYCGVDWHEIRASPDATFRISGIDGIEFSALPVTSKAPPYSPHREAPRPDDNIALMMTDVATGRRVFYAPGLAAIEPVVWAWMSRADCLLVDGSFWTDDEMIRLGVGRKHAHEMGHLALAGDHGMISWLGRLPRARRILIHINNTNPILDEDSPEHRELERAGIEVAYDGMEISIGA